MTKNNINCKLKVFYEDRKLYFGVRDNFLDFIYEKNKKKEEMNLFETIKKFGNDENILDKIKSCFYQDVFSIVKKLKKTDEETGLPNLFFYKHKFPEKINKNHFIVLFRDFKQDKE